MTRLLILAPLILVLCLASCSRSEKDKAQSAESPKPGNEPPAFDRVAYRTNDGKSSITLTSAEDLEFRTPDGKTQACKYSALDNTIHFMVGEQEMIFERMPGELKAADGTLYLGPSSQQSQAMQDRQNHALEVAEQLRVAEERRVEAVVQESKKPKEAGKTFAVEDGGDGRYEITVTDVSFQARQKTPPIGQTNAQDAADIWYGDFERIFDAKGELTILVLSGHGIHIRFKSEAQCGEVAAAIRAAWNKWRAKYPESERARVLKHGYAF